MQLQTSAILNVPLNIYHDNFTFIVNGEKYTTSKLIADLISSKIAKIHMIDPSIDEYEFDTVSKGDFSIFLKLIDFEHKSFDDNEAEFIFEIIDLLDSSMINIDQFETPITIENAINLIKIYEKARSCNRQYYEVLNGFIAKHFHKLLETSHEKLSTLRYETLESILSSKQLVIRNEDQLLDFINELYRDNKSYATLYDHVIFSNASQQSIQNFISQFDIDDITTSIWHQLCARLEQKCNIDNLISGRYLPDDLVTESEEKVTTFQVNNDLQGIISHIKNNSKSKIEEEIDFTASSIAQSEFYSSFVYSPKYVAYYDDNKKRFSSKNIEGSWICIDFKDRLVSPTGYTIRASSGRGKFCRPKNWIFEGSMNQNDWETIDKQTDCLALNRNGFMHTFAVTAKVPSYRYLRIRSTGPDTEGNHILAIESLEIYGELTEKN